MFASITSSMPSTTAPTTTTISAGPETADPGRQQDARGGLGHQQPAFDRALRGRLLQQHALDHEGGAEHDGGDEPAPRSAVERRAGGSVAGPGRHRQQRQAREQRQMPPPPANAR